MTEKIAISVLIPAYNAEKYLEKCIKSITGQSLKNIEIIIVNDGSTDKTLDILEKLRKSDNRIEVINQTNKGVSVARNNALKYVKGEYILWIDSDDWIDEGLEEIYNKSKKEDADIVVMDYWREENGEKKYVEDKIVENNIEYINEITLGKSTGYLWNKLIKTSLYRENGINFPENIKCGEDRVILPKLLYFSKKIIKLNKAYYHYIFNPESLSKKKYSNKEIFDKVLPDYINQIKDLENYFINDKIIKISNLKVVNGLWYFVKCDAFSHPSFILKKENKKIIEYFLEGVNEVEIETISLDKRIQFLLKGLKIFNTKYFIVIICVINKIKKFFSGEI